MKRVLFTMLSLTFFFISYAQTKIPIIKASKTLAYIRNGNNGTFEWTISPEARPDVWDVVVPKSKSTNVIFITDKDSISFNVEPYKNYNFIVLIGKDSAFTRIAGHPEPATFSNNYKILYNKKTVVEIPEVYELVNVIIALTNKGLNDSDLVNHETEYYKDVMNYFEKFKNEKVVLSFNTVLQKEWWKYFYLKMDAYAFGLKKGKLINNGIYDRVNWDYNNTILPFTEELEDFYEKTNFSKFYKNHQPLYNSQIKNFKDSINISEMQQWLNKNFPSTSYNCYKVIFSPLVGGSQSANKFDNNGFKEAQVHINFPYPDKSDKNYSAKANQLRNGSIAFTELNHLYINPEAEIYSMNENFISAFKDLKNWEAENSAAVMGYPKALACFEEYMNWALVSLFYLDYAPKDEQQTLINEIENNMKYNRGFSKFPEFDKELIRLYKNRISGATIADFYPEIIKWCRQQVN